MSKRKRQSDRDKRAAAERTVTANEAAKARAAKRSAEAETDLEEARVAIRVASAAVSRGVAEYERDGTPDAALKAQIDRLLSMQDRLLKAKEKYDEHWNGAKSGGGVEFDFDECRDELRRALDRIRKS